jgi:hypothetical protein
MARRYRQCRDEDEVAMDVTDWLRSLGLEQYAPAFQENNIGGDLLPSVTADDLKDLGIASVGHRRRLLEGIAALRAGSGATYERPEASALVPERSQSSNQPDAERRQVTVMFCDLVGSTALASRLDPEDLREVIGRYHGCVAQTVSRFTGSWRSTWAMVCWSTSAIRTHTRTTRSRQLAPVSR